MKVGRCFLSVAVLAVAAVPCLAAGPSWNGTWKLDQAKSKLTGDTFTIVAKGNGMYRYDSGSTFNYDFNCNGKAFHPIANRWSTCTGSDAAGFNFETKAKGKVLSKDNWTLSPDGKMLTMHEVEMRPNGSTNDYNDVYKRESGTKGLAGKWMDVKSSSTGAQTMIIATKGDWIRISNPQTQSVVEGKMDGSNLPMTGPNAPAGLWESIKAEGPNKVRFVVKYKSQVLREGTRALSADGKWITEEVWDPGKMNEKATLVFVRG